MKKYWFLACLCALFGTLLMAACDGSDEPEPGPTPPSRPADLPDNLYAMVKWEGSSTTCFMNKDAYMLYQPGLEPRLDCQMDSNYFHLLFDEEGHLKYIRGPLLQMHTVTGAAGGKETATKLYVTAYGKSFVLTDDDGEEGAKAVHRKENALDNTTLLQGLSLTELQLEGLSEALEIEAELKGSTGSLGTPDAKNRDIRRFLNMTRMLNRYMQMSDKSSSQLAQTIQSACPDKGEVSCAVGGVLGSSSALTADEKQLQALIGAWKETVNGGSSALVASRSEWARRPIVFMGVNTEVLPGTNSCTVNFFGELLTTGIGEVSNFVYGVCVTEVGSPVTAESLHRMGKFKANARGEVKSVTIPERFVVEGLKPGTEYVCRFYLQSYRDHSYMFEQKGTRFYTDAPLDCENDAELQVLSAQYYSYGGFTDFRCKATATKPSIEHISRWGVSVGDGFYPVSTLDDDDDDDDATFVIPVHRDAYQEINAEKHQARTQMPIRIWVQLEGEDFRRVSTARDVTLLYDQPVSVTFLSDYERSVGKNSTDYIKGDGDSWKYVELVGMPWVYYRVKFQVSGALFMDRMDMVANEYEYGDAPHYVNGLVYSGIAIENMQVEGIHDGENIHEVGNVECPSGSYSIEGRSYEAKAYKENWLWLMFRSAGQSYASDNALHYLTFIKPNFCITDSYDKEYKTFMEHTGY